MTTEEKKEKLTERLKKLLALSQSQVNEHEANLAAERLQALLIEHNLSIADLERSGRKTAQVGEFNGPDLGKAAFKWKFELASEIAEHYFCLDLSTYDTKQKQLRFVGRPENVEALTLLYTWLVDQIKSLATVERRNHYIRTNEHIDPLRWQLAFGQGCSRRIGERLREIRRQRETGDPNSTALVVFKHHATEISDWLEQQYGYRKDGKPTKRGLEWDADYKKRMAAKADFKAVCEAAGEMDKYYDAYPYEHPDQIARRKAEAEKYWAEERKKEERNARRRAWRPENPEKARQDEERYRAKQAGREAGDKVNLQPFLEGGGHRKEVE